MRYPPLLIALFIALLLKPFAEGTGAAILPGGFFLILVFGTLIYAFRHIRSLALRLTVLGIATVTLRVLADQRHLPAPELLSQALSFIAMIFRDGHDVFRSASSAQGFVRSGNRRGLFVPHCRTGLDGFLLFNLLAFTRLNFRFTGHLDSDRFR